MTAIRWPCHAGELHAPGETCSKEDDSDECDGGETIEVPEGFTADDLRRIRVETDFGDNEDGRGLKRRVVSDWRPA